jgi:hypothetical protein
MPSRGRPNAPPENDWRDVDPREKYGGPPTFNMSEELYGLEGREIPDFWLEPPGLQRESPERPGTFRG